MHQSLNGYLLVKATPYPPNYWRLRYDPTIPLRTGINTKKVGGRGMDLFKALILLAEVYS